MTATVSDPPPSPEPGDLHSLMSDEYLAAEMLRRFGPLVVMGLGARVEDGWVPYPHDVSLNTVIDDGLRAIPSEEPVFQADDLAVSGDREYAGPVYPGEPADTAESPILVDELMRRRGVWTLFTRQIFPKLDIPLTARVKAAMVRTAIVDDTYLSQFMQWADLADMPGLRVRGRGLDIAEEQTDGLDN